MTVISLAFGLYLTSETVKDYHQYDVFTQTKRIVVTSSLMPSVTFCFRGSETDNLNAFFNKAEFKSPNGLVTDLAGKQFYQEDIPGHCIMFNQYTNKSENRLLTAYTISDSFVFFVNFSIGFRSINIFLSDTHDNILDWSQYVTTSYNVKGLYFFNFEKEVEVRLEEPYNHCQNVSDITYRQSNCLAKCKNEKIASKYNCTLRNFYSIPGYSFCNYSEFDSVCKEQCLKECVSTKFDIFFNNPEISSNFSDIVEFRFYFLDLSYLEITQTPKMSGYPLLNEIGGALGLFVGVTFLSLLEMLEFFFEVFFVFYL